MNWPTDLERDLLADACRDDFETFCRIGLGFTDPLNRKGRWWDDAVHRPLCQWFQAQAKTWLANRSTSGRTYLAVLIPRACAKSLLLTRAGMAWLHLQDPNLSTYIGNEKLDLAEEFLSTISDWMTLSEDDFCRFTWLYGMWRGDSKRWRGESITHAARRQARSESSFGIWSPTSALTGRHPDILCMDDLVSYDALKKDTNWFDYAYSHMLDLIPVVEPNGLIMLIGTRYGENDPFGRSFKDDGIASISGHTSFDEYQPTPNGLWHVYFLSGLTKDGEAAIPTVWPKREIDRLLAKSPIKTAAQILNRPSAHNLRPILEWQFDKQITPDLPKPTEGFLVFHTDTAFKRTSLMAGGSESALDVAFHHTAGGRIDIIDCYSAVNFRAETFVDMLIERYQHWTAKGYRVEAITDEIEMAGKVGTWEQYLRDKFSDAGISWDKMPVFYAFNRTQGEKKAVRITNAINFIVNGQIFFYKEAQHLSALRHQICNQPHAFPNDLADAFADTVNADFFSGILPRLKDDAARSPHEFGAYERNLKPFWSEQRDNIDDDSLYSRPPIGGAPAGRLLQP